MRFMPSSLTSKSHRLLTALVDSKHKKVFKVKAVITETDPEKMKHDIEKVSLEILRLPTSGNNARRDSALCHGCQVRFLNGRTMY